jgi:hypothetical protein
MHLVSFFLYTSVDLLHAAAAKSVDNYAQYRYRTHYAQYRYRTHLRLYVKHDRH